MKEKINIKDSSILTKRVIIRPITKEELSLLNSSSKIKETFSLILKDTNELIGKISFEDFPSCLKHPQDTELLGTSLDCYILESYRNNGYGVEVVKAIISHSFFSRHLDFLLVSHLENDKVSKRLIEKCNFKYYTQNDELISYLLFNPYKRNNCHCQLCVNSTTCLCSMCPNKSFCEINHPIECKYKVN